MSRWERVLRRPGSWPRKRTGAAVAGVVAAALGAGVLVVLDDGGGPVKPAAAAVKVDENEAQRRARESGKPVTVETTLSATGTTVANPDGSFTRTEHVQPVRVRAGTGWADVDTTLRRTGAGFATTSTTSKLVFSAGGPAEELGRPARQAPRRAPQVAGEDAMPAGSGDPAVPSGEPTLPPVVTSWPTGPIPDVAIDGAWAERPLPAGALVRMTTPEGRSFTVSWPNGPLPVPQITRDQAVYPEVFPGVDLVLTARDGGFGQVLVVKSREAAANPQVAEVAYRLSADGLAFRFNADSGSTQVVDSAGTPVATSPTPYMWDSAGHAPGSVWDQQQSSGAEPAQASGSPVPGAVSTPPAAVLEAPASGPPGLGGPEPGTHSAVVGSALEGDRLVLAPDQGLFTGADTVFPVFVDPSFFGHMERWTIAHKRFPTSTFWMGSYYNGGTDLARIGYESDTLGTARSFFQMDWDESLVGVNVKSATFRILETHAWSCQARQFQLWLTGGIYPTTSWSNQPGGENWANTNNPGVAPYLLGTKNESHGYNANCPGEYVGFDVGDTAMAAAANRWVNITLGLKANDESDTYAWKKFTVNPSLEVTYWRPPNPPSDITLTPGGACSTASPGPTVGQSDVTINARGSDPDGDIKDIWLTAARADKKDSPNAADFLQFGYLPLDGQGWMHYRIPVDRLEDGQVYAYRMQARDLTGAASSPAAVVWCYFKVDKTRPSPPGVSSPQYKAGSDTAWPTGADYGTAGTFTFTANGSPDTTAYAYSFDSTAFDNRVTAPAPGADATITATPVHAGPVQLYVKALDAGGNLSDQTVYSFFAEPRNQVDGPMDFTGDQNPDLALVDGAGNLRIYPSFSGGRLNQSIDAVKADDGSGSPAPSQAGPGYFTGALTTYYGDWWGGDGFQDLIARMPGDNKLWIYPGNGRGALDINGRIEVLLPAGAPDPKDFTQILAAGDATGDGLPDLFAVVGNTLWGFGGWTGASLLDAAELSASGTRDWDTLTIHGVGDLTGDGAFDLVARSKNGGQLYLVAGTKNPGGTGTALASLGTAPRTVYAATGWQPAAYPWLVAVPDVTGDTVPDFWAQKADGTRWLFQGGRTTLGAGSNLDGDVWSFCRTFPGATGGTRQICGPILDKYLSLPETDRPLPSMDTATTSPKPGKYLQLRRPGASTDTDSIWWSPDTGAHWVTGSNRTIWAGLGYEGSYLGFPTSDEYPVTNGQRSDFQGGYTRWNRATGTGRDYTYGAETPTPRRSVSGDFNGDGKADIATVVDYGNCAAAFWTHPGRADGGFDAPVESAVQPTGTWCVTGAKYTAGDFNGDGRDDITALFRYNSGLVRAFTYLAQPSGGFNPAITSWEQASGFDFDRTTLLAGDTNGDHRDDVIAVYGYSDGRIAHLTWRTRTDGGLNPPVTGYQTPVAGWWWYENARYTAGDFNGDGRTDIGAAYMFANGDVATFTSPANPDGTIGTPVQGWNTTGAGWDRNAVQLTAGDVNADGRADMAMMYAFPNDRMVLYTFTTTPTGVFNAPLGSTDTGTNQWNAYRSTALLGDVNGDGRADIHTLYGYANGSWAAWTFKGQPTAGFDSGTRTWNTPTGTW